MKKATKKVTKSVSRAKPRAVVPVRRTTSGMKEGHTHSAIFSDVTLMALAIFFTLFGLFAVMIISRQNQDVESYIRLQKASASTAQY